VSNKENTMTENPESGFKFGLANLKPADSSSKVKVTFPDGATREYPNGTTGLDIAKGISPSLAKRTVAMALDGALTDLTDPITHDAKIDFVNRAATRLALTSSVNPAVTGQTVTFTAAVAAVAPGAGTPSGTVTFRDGSVVLGTVAVGAGGTATFTTSFAAAGGHVITAIYNGDSNFVGSSQSLTEQVNAHATPKPTRTGLVASVNPATVGQAVTFTATVQGPVGSGTPTGTVTFFVGSQAVAKVKLDANGQARLTGFFSVAGLFTIRAVYSGDTNFDVSSQSLTEQVIRR
jgi:hypothetical protein